MLLDAGIVPSIVAGTSAGAIVGAAYSAGVEVDEISRLFNDAKWPRLAKIAWRDSLSMFNTQPMEDFIKAKIGDYSFEQLPRKFACVACDLMKGETVIFDSGPVAPAVRASAAFPVVFSPIQDGEKLLIDGGVMNNLPVDLVRKMGADYVISVDLSSPVKLTKKPSNMMEILFAVIDLMQTRSAYPDPADADCTIHPDVENLSAWTFSDTEELEKRGRSAVEGLLAKIKSDLGIK